MKKIIKNNAFIITMTGVLVAAIAVTSIVLMPKTKALEHPATTALPEALPSQNPVNSVEMDQPAKEYDDIETNTEDETEVIIPIEDGVEEIEPSASGEVIKEEIKEKPEESEPTIEVEIETEVRPPKPENEDTVTATDDDVVVKEDYGDEPYYGADKTTPPPNNIEDIPDFVPDDTPADQYIEDGKEPGSGIKF